MKKLILLASFLAVGFSAYADQQVYFKIAVNEKDYSTFLTDRISTKRTTLHYLATRMREPFFKPNDLSRDFYEIKVTSGMKYFDRKVVQYDIIPKYKDRFRHLIMVSEIEGAVIRKEVYDADNKLVFAFTDLDSKRSFERPKPEKIRYKKDDNSFKGFEKISDRSMKDGTKHLVFTDGLNRFSVFKKRANVETHEKRRILYGNYVLRKKVDRHVYTVVGTIPFSEMEKVVAVYAGSKEKK